MSNYARQKIHMAAEMLRNVEDVRDALANAYAMELSKLDEADLPEDYEDRIESLLDWLSLPEEVDTIDSMGRAHAMVNALSDDEIDSVVDEIFELEDELI